MADAWDCHWGEEEEKCVCACVCVCVCLYEKCCCFLTSHGTSYGKEKEHASALRLNDQRT